MQTIIRQFVYPVLDVSGVCTASIAKSHQLLCIVGYLKERVGNRSAKKSAIYKDIKYINWE